MINWTTVTHRTSLSLLRRSTRTCYPKRPNSWSILFTCKRSKLRSRILQEHSWSSGLLMFIENSDLCQRLYTWQLILLINTWAERNFKRVNFTFSVSQLYSLPPSTRRSIHPTSETSWPSARTNLANRMCSTWRRAFSLSSDSKSLLQVPIGSCRDIEDSL